MTINSSAAAHFDVAQAKVQASYDDVPYTSYPYSQSHPSRIAATAALLGVSTKDIEIANVLEIGCAAGGNLIPMAAAYPKARFLGIDLSGRQIDEGRARVERLGLSNIELRHQDVVTFARPEQGYDFIICHGVYSWVTEPVRNAILALCASCLTPEGVAYVSYNVLPGWRPRQVVRDAMIAHVSDLTDPAQRLNQASAFLAFIKEHAPASPYGDAIRDVASWLGKMNASYIVHEFLEHENAPCTFRDFMRTANQHGLVFLAESEIGVMLPDNYGSIASTIRKLGGSDIVAAEQYIDVFSGRTFRQTLLIPARRLTRVSRVVSPDRLTGLHFLSRLSAIESDDRTLPYAFGDGTGRVFKTSQETTRKAFEHIEANQPGSFSFEEIVQQLRADGRAANTRDEAQLAAALHSSLLVGLLSASTKPVRVGSWLSERPIALEVARSDAAYRTSTVNLRHEPVEVDVVAQHLLPLLDGSNGIEALRTALKEAVNADTVWFTRGGAPVTDVMEVDECVKEHVELLLRRLGAQAVLLPNETYAPTHAIEG